MKKFDRSRELIVKGIEIVPAKRKRKSINNIRNIKSTKNTGTRKTEKENVAETKREKIASMIDIAMIAITINTSRNIIKSRKRRKTAIMIVDLVHMNVTREITVGITTDCSH